jgi:two-component system, NarL family, nitrate/nitrite response regulator NarL
MNGQMGSRIRLLLLDELSLPRAGLARLLEAESGFEVAGECGDVAEALERLKGGSIDVVLLDFRVGPKHADDFMSAARAAGYRGSFLIVASAVDPMGSADVIRHGASGVFLKSEPPDRLTQAIRLISSGAVWVDQKIIQLLAERYIHSLSAKTATASDSHLEIREQMVLEGILEGLTNRKIANGMGLSESSVKNIIQSLFAKAGVRSRGQLVRFAIEGSLEDIGFGASKNPVGEMPLGGR